MVSPRSHILQTYKRKGTRLHQVKLSEVLQRQRKELTQATILVKETLAGAIYRESDISGSSSAVPRLTHCRGMATSTL